MSFSDLMSSGRGPGVIGLLMALFVLLGFGVLFMFAFDEGFQGRGATIESQIASQAREIESCKDAVRMGQSSLARAPAQIAKANTLAGLNQGNQAAVGNIAGLQAEIETGNAALTAAGVAWETYKDRYRESIRGKAKGQVIDKLETRNGVVYNHVNIREITAVGIQIRHDDGQKRIPFEELPDEMQDLYQFDPAQKQKAMAAEDAARDEHDAAVAVVSDQVEEQMSQKKLKDEAEAKEKLQGLIAEKLALMASIEAEIKNLERERTQAEFDAQAARTAGKTHLNRSGSITAQIRSKQSRLSGLSAEIARMNARL